MASVPKRIHLTWRDVDKAASSVADQICQSKTHPEHILSIAKGGLIPAAMVAYRYALCNYQCPSLSSVLVQSYEGEEKGKLKLGFMSSHDVSRLLGMNHLLLIVDDITDSGETMKVMKEMFPQAQTAALVHKETSVIRPDYVGRNAGATSHQWYVFPWEKYIMRDRKQ